MIRELGARDRLALLGAVVVMVNPILWFDSVVWGQVDSVGVLFLMLGLRALWHDRPERAAIFAVIAAIVKPQLGILIPIVAVVTIRRALRPVPHDPDGAASASRSAATRGADRASAPDRDDGDRRLPDRARALPAVRVERHRAVSGGAILRVRAAGPDRARGRRLPVPHGQRVQRLGHRSRRPRGQSRRRRPMGMRRGEPAGRPMRSRHRPVRRPCRPSRSVRHCWSWSS